MFRSTSLRLAALYTAAFALSVVVLGAITLVTTRVTLSREFDARIKAETVGLAQEARKEGLSSVVEAVQERDRTPGALEYGLCGPNGEPLAGRLAPTRPPLGWSKAPIRQPGGGVESVRMMTTVLPGGARLTVGDDDDRIEALQRAVLSAFAWAFGGVVVLGALGGYGLSRSVRRRLGEMTDAAEGIIDGDLARRIPVGGADDDLDRLAASFNRTLDRIATLMESLRQVSTDIAHDLRTPLTRLRQRLESSRSLASDDERAEALSGALEDVDAILETFSALLRIAQIEGGARRRSFRPVELSSLAKSMVDDLAPSAEDAGRALSFDNGGEIWVDGDRELLAQMLVNLIDNALRHAGDRAQVRTHLVDQGAVISVCDNGPGVPSAERSRIFDRFYRLERSRSTPGSGLGLALVAAIARLHGATLDLVDRHPGIEVRATFPLSQKPRTLAFPNLQDSASSAASP